MFEASSRPISGFSLLAEKMLCAFLRLCHKLIIFKFFFASLRIKCIHRNLISNILLTQVLCGFGLIHTV